ncbi:MAG: BMP family ABC transporter substrate-binding protein [Clostridiales bacterium]|nr:BMP family ABC transporter substrate-binding protein [Clostridiales bacterium]
MKHTKKILALVLALAMTFALAACSSSGDDGDDGDTPQEAVNLENITKDSIKIGVIHIEDPYASAGYSVAHQQGIDEMVEALDLDPEKQLIVVDNVSDNDTQATESAIRSCIEDGANVIFATSWGYMETVKKLAAEFPQVIFSHCSGYESNDTNFNNYFGRIYEARYLAGIAAGLKTQTNKIGYVAAQGMKNAEVTGGINAFALGVKSVNPDATIHVQVTNTWYDVSLEKSAAEALLNMDCDVIAQHQDTVQPQIAAQEQGKWGVGYNSDMSEEAPDAVLTSVIWNWGVYYTQTVQAIIDNTWTCENYFGTMEEGLVDITALTDNCAEGTREAVDEAKEKIISGELAVFSGPLVDNTDTEQCAEGQTLDDSYIAGGIDWYLDNVTLES